ncbi:MAG TPA: hypothetical protein VGN32_12200 [Ktedonobacterales bacterium]|jgi:hypothetical protein|nr:hypothetical protein [Ktedonobacterales bacterium]
MPSIPSRHSGITGFKWLALAAFVPVLLACGATTTIVQGGGTPTPHPTTPTPVPPPPHAISWNQLDGSGAPQIWASINDGAPTQITHTALPVPPCGLPFYGAAMFSPDLAHIIVATGGCSTDAQIYGGLYIVETATGAATQVPLPNQGGVLTNQRAYGWINNTSVFAIGNWNNADEGASYTLGAGAATPLPGFPGNAREGVVRGTTLWYVTEDTGSVSGYEQTHVVLHHYDLGAHSVASGSIDLGSYGKFQGSPGDYHLQGWDVSADGAHVAYQFTTPQKFIEVQGATGVQSQTIFFANADGSGATPILQYMVTNVLVRMRFSPNGKLVGITEARGTPDVLSGCVNSPGKKGDPCLQFYTPDAVEYPAWHWDSGYMVTASDQTAQTGERILYKDIPGQFNAGVYAQHGESPWSTPES